ncbi:hypothetical protein ACFX19_028141 [Malus domestica]
MFPGMEERLDLYAAQVLDELPSSELQIWVARRLVCGFEEESSSLSVDFWIVFLCIHTSRKLPHLLHDQDTDDDSYRPSKRARADFRVSIRVLDSSGLLSISVIVLDQDHVAQFPICGTIKWRLSNKSAKVSQHAADLISRIDVVMKQCQEEQLMGHLGVVLYEYLGEEYPEVLGSIMGALKAIVNVIGMTKLTPPIKDLLPRLTQILKNRYETVQENWIDLVGRIADRGAEFVPARDWMRICFELLAMLKAHNLPPQHGLRGKAVICTRWDSFVWDFQEQLVQTSLDYTKFSLRGE